MAGFCQLLWIRPVSLSVATRTISFSMPIQQKSIPMASRQGKYGSITIIRLDTVRFSLTNITRKPLSVHPCRWSWTDHDRSTQTTAWPHRSWQNAGIHFHSNYAFYSGHLRGLFEDRFNPVHYAITAKGTGRLEGLCQDVYNSSSHEEDSTYTSSKSSLLDCFTRSKNFVTGCQFFFKTYYPHLFSKKFLRASFCLFLIFLELSILLDCLILPLAVNMTLMLACRQRSRLAGGQTGSFRIGFEMREWREVFGE